MKKRMILRILIFYLIALIQAYALKYDLLNLSNYIQPNSGLKLLLFSPLYASGLFIGGLLAIYLLKKERTTLYSIFGTSKKWSIIMLIIPLILLAIFGVENVNNENNHYYGALAGLGILIYSFCEEVGWRGYLQDELQSLKEWKRAFIIGGFWFIWHIPEVLSIGNIQFLGWLILGSWGIGRVITGTKSVIAATCFHMIFNLVMFNPFTRDGISGEKKIIILVVSILCWLVIIKLWEKEKTSKSTI